MNAAGGATNGGRQLLSWALKAGVERGQITVSYSTWSYSTQGDKKIWGRSLLRQTVQVDMSRVLTMTIFLAQAMVERVRGGRLREVGLKSGLVTEHDLEEMAKAWEEWAERDDASLAMMHGEILIQR
jgi:hypothetical protein